MTTEVVELCDDSDQCLDVSLGVNNQTRLVVKYYKLNSSVAKWEKEVLGLNVCMGKSGFWPERLNDKKRVRA